MMLDERIKARILDDHKKLTADARLYPRPKLEEARRDTRDRCDPVPAIAPRGVQGPLKQFVVFFRVSRWGNATALGR
jgi:hypothetical protein